MCGLAGAWHPRGPDVPAETVARMLDRQRARGPDDRGVWSGGRIALGLDRLSILDPSDHGHQPFEAPAGRGVLVYNGEIYNWRSLRRELGEAGVEFRSECDTEVVLHALDRWGPEVAIPRFNGMFALAWFDRIRDTLWLARDRSGIKPLYLAQRDGVIAFASEAKALFAHPAIPPRPDVHALVTNVYLGRLAGDWTGFDQVRSVVPGSSLRISPAGHETLTWFDVERDVDVERILASSREPFAAHVSGFRRRIEHSVALHLQSDAPLAVMCSGGLDSSLVAAIARQHKPDLVAFVAEVEGAPVAEAEQAQRVADHIGVPLERIRIGEDDYPRLWCRAAWHNDDPMYFPQNPLTLGVSEAVRDAGFKVLLTGEGADELFGGYGWQRAASRMWMQRRWLARLIPDVAATRWLFRRLQALQPLDLERLAEAPFTRRSEWNLAPAATDLVIDAGMRRRIAADLFTRLAALPDVAERAFLARGYDDFYHHLRVILASNDKMTMAASIEMRVPFLENDLIDFGLHLAVRSKLGATQGKRVVRSASADLLPQATLRAAKVGFAIPARFWRGYLPILRGGMMAELFKWRDAEWERLRGVILSNRILEHRLVSMELWAQMHFNGQSPQQLEARLRDLRRAPVSCT